jgi:hypothetical protein
VTTSEKPFSPACERNRDPILLVLSECFAHTRRVIEIGSGTGQHAAYIAAALPHLIWQCSERADRLPGIRQWLDEAGLSNTPQPIALDVGSPDWPRPPFDAAFTANTLHIMSWPEVEAMFAGLDQTLTADARLVIYGPFRRGGLPTSESNKEFDAKLRAEASHMGIRDLEEVNALAVGIGLHQMTVIEMPANNLCVLWQRGA